MDDVEELLRKIHTPPKPQCAGFRESSCLRNDNIGGVTLMKILETALAASSLYLHLADELGYVCLNTSRIHQKTQRITVTKTDTFVNHEVRVFFVVHH